MIYNRVCFIAMPFSINGIDILTDLFLSPKYRLETLVACVLLPNTLAIRSRPQVCHLKHHTLISSVIVACQSFPTQRYISLSTLNKVIYPLCKSHDSADDKIGSIAIFTGGGYNLITSWITDIAGCKDLNCTIHCLFYLHLTNSNASWLPSLLCHNLKFEICNSCHTQQDRCCNPQSAFGSWVVFPILTQPGWSACVTMYMYSKANDLSTGLGPPITRDFLKGEPVKCRNLWLSPLLLLPSNNKSSNRRLRGIVKQRGVLFPLLTKIICPHLSLE